MVQRSKTAARTSVSISSSRPNMGCGFTANDIMKTGGQRRGCVEANKDVRIK